MIVTIQMKTFDDSIMVYDLCSLSRLEEYSFNKEIEHSIDVDVNSLEEKQAIVKVFDFISSHILEE